MKWLFGRLKEGSTYAGLGLLAMQVLQTGADYHSPAFWGTVAAGVAAVLTKDKGAV